MAAEKNFENRIKEFLQSVGIYALGTPIQKMKVSPIGYYEKRWGNKMTTSGLPDMHIVVYNHSIEVEVKAPNGQASVLQKRESYEDKQMFLEELGLEESGVNRLIKKAYALLNLQTFITAGEMEVKAWTYKRGWKAPQCAGVIHTDFEKGFIRAEVIKYEDYIQYKSEAAIKEAGKLGIEGKEYVVQDGDIMHFRFNV